MVRTCSMVLALLLCSMLFGLAAPEQPAATFYRIIRANNLVALDAVMKQGTDVNVRDADGVTPLMYATAVGSVDAMTRLIEAGADVNARNTLGSFRAHLGDERGREGTTAARSRRGGQRRLQSRSDSAARRDHA